MGRPKKKVVDKRIAERATRSMKKNNRVVKTIAGELGEILDSGLYGDTVTESSENLAKILKDRGMA